MNAYVPFVLLTIISSASLETWSFQDIFSEPVNFFGEHSDRVKKFVTSYDDVVRMGDTIRTIDDYFGEQQRKITSDVNSYVESIKESGRKVAGAWSFVPDQDPASMLENPVLTLTVSAIVAKNGYSCETHTVVSQGYILNIHRIPHSKLSTNVPKKTVLLQHGLFASSADWILNGPDKGLAYALADAGYDVWMANIRGNRYSREHVWLKTDSKSYWDFSWHDVALHDQPAIIDYIFRYKGAGTKISYIGHSMGTTILFAMLSLRPEYNQLLSAGFALAPVVFLSDLKSPLKSLAPLASDVASIDMLGGTYEFIPKTSSLGKITESCNGVTVDSTLCKNVAFYICGYNEKQFNQTLLTDFLAHFGTGTSWKTVVHFSQEIVNNGRFQYFDYGSYYNLQVYGSLNPPEYDLSKVTLPIKLFWSKNDLLSSEKDVSMLYYKLPNRPDTYLVPDTEFNHLDYLWAVDAPTLLNSEVVRSLERVM